MRIPIYPYTTYRVFVFTGTSWYATVFLVVNAALGAGLLNFPKAYDQSGGIVVAVIVQAVSIKTYSHKTINLNSVFFLLLCLEVNLSKKHLYII